MAKKQPGRRPRRTEVFAKIQADYDAGQAVDKSPGLYVGDTYYLPVKGGLKEFARGAVRIEALYDPLKPMPWRLIQNSWFGEALNKSMRANDPGAVVLLLEDFLRKATGEVIDGIFVGFAKSPGAKKKKSTDDIVAAFYRLRRRLGKDPTGKELACEIAGYSTFMKLSRAKQHRLRNKFMGAVKRHLRRSARDSSAKSVAQTI